jgi:hypothetical protein
MATEKMADFSISSAKTDSDVGLYTGKDSKKPVSKTVWRWIRYFLIVVMVAAAFMGPVIKFSSSEFYNDLDDPLSRQYQNLLFYTFLWLLVSWLGTVAIDLGAIALPYVFRFVIR